LHSVSTLKPVGQTPLPSVLAKNVPHAFEFSQVTSSAGEAWIDKNLGASQVATSSTDPASYGDLYQWVRPADEHQEIQRHY
jgi:hypothetical protein